MKVTRSYWLGLGSGLILSAMLTLVISPQQGQALIAHEPSSVPSVNQQVTTSPKTEAPTPSSNSPVETIQGKDVASTPNSTSAQSTPSKDGLTAQLVFTQSCWIEIKVDGQPSFQGIFTAGTSKEVKGITKIELVSVGNAGGLSVTLNGKALPSLGNAGQVIHNVILTQDTLKSL